VVNRNRHSSAARSPFGTWHHASPDEAATVPCDPFAGCLEDVDVSR
jgi:hypothetical protein